MRRHEQPTSLLERIVNILRLYGLVAINTFHPYFGKNSEQMASLELREHAT